MSGDRVRAMNKVGAWWPCPTMKKRCHSQKAHRGACRLSRKLSAACRLSFPNAPAEFEKSVNRSLAVNCPFFSALLHAPSFCEPCGKTWRAPPRSKSQSVRPARAGVRIAVAACVCFQTVQHAAVVRRGRRQLAPFQCPSPSSASRSVRFRCCSFACGVPSTQLTERRRQQHTRSCVGVVIEKSKPRGVRG